MCRISRSLAVITWLLIQAHTATATLSLPSLQPISGFSDSCTKAYDTTIASCPDASNFINPSGPVCTEDCFLALINAGAAIQNACQYQTANRGTVIGQAFIGNLGYWLCNGENSGEGNAATTSTASIIVTSSASASSASAISSPSSASASTTSSKSVQSSSSSTNSKTTLSTSTTVESSSSSTTKTTSSSESSATTHSTSTKASAKTSSTSSSASTATKPTSTITDSTPFDQTVPKSNSASSAFPFSLKASTTSSAILSMIIIWATLGI